MSNSNKALVLALHEAEQDVTKAVSSVIQKHGLPCYLMEPILYKVYMQLVECKNTELANARAEEALQVALTQKEVGDANG